MHAWLAKKHQNGCSLERFTFPKCFAHQLCSPSAGEQFWHKPLPSTRSYSSHIDPSCHGCWNENLYNLDSFDNEWVAQGCLIRYHHNGDQDRWLQNQAPTSLIIVRGFFRQSAFTAVMRFLVSGWVGFGRLIEQSGEVERPQSIQLFNSDLLRYVGNDIMCWTIKGINYEN